MNTDDSNFLIIGGTNKAGTTSVFRYLADHPEVCAAHVKETAFFIQESGIDPVDVRLRYHRCFPVRRPGEWLLAEASTGYLANAAEVAPRIKSVLGDPRVVFMLRNPIDRLWSYYRFQIGQLQIDETISFEKFVDMSESISEGIAPAPRDVDQRHFHAMAMGRYANNIRIFFEALGSERVAVMFFDDLRNDPRTFMRKLASFAGISPDYYDDYEFHKANVTFSSRRSWLHKFAMSTNRRFESFLSRRPVVKRALVAAYKRINMRDEKAAPMPPVVRSRLANYYSSDLRELERLLGKKMPATWSINGRAD